MTTNRSFEELDAWKLSRSYKLSIKSFCSHLPKNEQYGLRSQLIRASRSITANIAEGWGRYHYQENIQFCRQARGSLFETLDHLIEAKDCNYINESEFVDLKRQFETCLLVLNGYISYLKRLKENNK